MPQDFELFAPSEGDGNVNEELSENAKQRFAAAAQALKKQQKDEKKSKKKDGQVARTIIQFLNDDTHSHLFILISKLVARNCPSIFVLGILSLINNECLAAVHEYFAEHNEKSDHDIVESSIKQLPSDGDSIIQGKDIGKQNNILLIEWITRLQIILSHDAERILESLMINSKHLDGSLLQLTIFVLQEFFQVREQKELPYEKAQPLTASILQTVLEPFLHLANKQTLKSGEEDDEEQ